MARTNKPSWVFPARVSFVSGRAREGKAPGGLAAANPSGALVFSTSEHAGYFTSAVVAFSSQHFAFGTAQQSGAAVDGDVSSSWQHAAAASEQQAGVDAEPGQHEPSLQRSPFDQ